MKVAKLYILVIGIALFMVLCRETYVALSQVRPLVETIVRGK